MTEAAFDDTSPIRALVQRHRVLWGIMPKRLPVSLKGQRVGFELELWGSHDHPGEAGSGECNDCHEVIDALREIASFITPAGCEFRTRTGGTPVDVRHTVYPRNGFGRSLRLGLEVVCRNGHQAVSSQCDGGCFLSMKGRLEALGARQI